MKDQWRVAIDIKKNYLLARRERPIILKFKQIMSASQKHTLEKLCKFIRDINKSYFPYDINKSHVLCDNTRYK